MRTAALGHPTKFISRTEDWMGAGQTPYPHPIRRCPDDGKLEDIKKKSGRQLDIGGGGVTSASL